MPYDETLAERVREALGAERGLDERRMFGGLAFMVDGHMACGIVGDELMVRLGEEAADAALDEPHTRPMDFTGRPLRTMVFVEPAGTATPAELQAWVDRALAHARTLPPKRSR
jgi:TfoX/Sxy family transcriptional regulator of competence genes